MNMRKWRWNPPRLGFNEPWEGHDLHIEQNEQDLSLSQVKYTKTIAVSHFSLNPSLFLRFASTWLSAAERGAVNIIQSGRSGHCEFSIRSNQAHYLDVKVT